ncbi:NAD(+) synthase [Longibacter salinarum]|uniref:Glutamine-dependent NAD(+) synthetase n=1 Tax=Longibacter salinarum TaxID=1850348 RepID=A0A2A8D2F9_9BACT|nr:NAD(+) synthase [Longibacter salinarum]PEN15135.1 NAD(+) synthase [Longibacter salinarum]
MNRPFSSLYSHDFVRVAVGVPRMRVAEPSTNAERTIALARRADDQHAGLVLFPEMGLTCYTNDDLFHQDALLEAARDALKHVRDASQELRPLLLVGLPLRVEGQLFNAAVAVHRGRILGVSPKTYLPNYREFYEKRQFTPGGQATFDSVQLFGETVPFGNNLMYDASTLDGFTVFPEICEDVWTPIPPSTYAAMGGATICANLSASNITMGKASYRRQLCANQSGRCLSAYLYAASGPGESTTDMAWDGHALIYENARRMAESERFAEKEQLITADIDVGRLQQERMRMTSFNDNAAEHRERIQSLRRIPFDFDVPAEAVPLKRTLERYPYVPANPALRDERCREAYNIQVQGLAQRLRATGIEKLVIGISGGLDSTQALLVAARTMDQLGLPRENILGYTLPGYATSDRTRENSHRLMDALGISSREIDITPLTEAMFDALDHPFHRGEDVYDITFENVQAGARTSLLFRLANHEGGMVVGTGDLSELALGWATYGVGDHMSHYAVNASVPKTLISHLIEWVCETDPFGDEATDVLRSILNTEISPELVPGSGDGEEPSQSSEDIVGPYPLQDFNLYYISRFGFRPSKVAFLSHHAFGPGSTDRVPGVESEEYDLATIKSWLRFFIERFFQFSQFKRSAIPNAPKVGSGGSLSPRGDWRAPSDASAKAWLDELENVPDQA